MSANEDRRRKPRPTARDERYFRKPLMPELVRSTVSGYLTRATTAQPQPNVLHDRFATG
jgi:hypothetical protein